MELIQSLLPMPRVWLLDGPLSPYVDAFQAQGLRIFGPSKAAAQIEASKAFSKKLMRHADVPTAEFRIFDHPEPARKYIETREYPVVVKADGLAAGKGVIVCSTISRPTPWCRPFTP